MSGKPLSAEDIAADLRAAVPHGQQAFGRAMARHYAQKLDIRHVPPLAADGLFDREAFAAHMEKENAAFARALPDLCYENPIEVRGTEIITRMTLSGTAADGSAVRATIPISYTVQNGEVVAVTTEVDPQTVATMTKILSGAGFEAAR